MWGSGARWTMIDAQTHGRIRRKIDRERRFGFFVWIRVRFG